MNIHDDETYEHLTESQFRAYEELCRRCGDCCGANGDDPCSNLRKQDDGRYSCIKYAERLGPQKTVSGKIFTCVNIRDVHPFGVSYNNCPYCGSHRG